MELYNANKNLHLLATSLINNHNCLKSTNDTLIFGFIFGFYQNSIKEFNNETINHVKILGIN